MWKWALLFIAVLYLSFQLGVAVGKADSPDYSSEASNVAFVLSTAQLRQDKGKITGTLRAGWTDYRYQEESDKIESSLRLDLLRNGYKPPKRWASLEFDKINALTGTAAVVEGGIAAQMTRTLAAAKAGSARRWQVALVTTVGAITGGLPGYYFGHSDEMEYDTEQFKRAVSDIRLWRFLAARYRQCLLYRDLADGSRPRLESIFAEKWTNCQKISQFSF